MWIRGMLSKTREWIENLYKEQLVASLSHSGRVYGCKISTLMAWVQMALLFRSQMSPLKWSPALKTNSPFSYLKAKPISETSPPPKKKHKKTILSFSNAIKHLRKPCNMREKQTSKNSYFIYFPQFYWNNWHEKISHQKWVKIRTSLVVQWLRLCTPKAGGQGSISAQRTRSHMTQLREELAFCNKDRRHLVLWLRLGMAK